MAKGQKSSATSATRKKHARKTAGNAPPELPLPKEKKKEKGKGKKNEPARVKVYIPPRKPAPVRPNPLDSLGIAKVLPPELLIVLRRLAKKDSVTKRKALEEFQSDWIDKVHLREDENGLVESALQTAFPVWIHHCPSLFLSPSRRIRSLAATIHTSLLRVPSILKQMIFFLQEPGDATQIESVIGSWAMAAEDLDRAVSQQAKQSWNLVFRSPSSSSTGVHLYDTLLTPLLSSVKRSILDPAGLYLDLNPVQPTSAATLPAHASPRNKAAAKRPPPPTIGEAVLSRKPEEDEESELDRKGRLRAGGLGVVKWMLEEEQIQMHEGLSELLMLPFFWTSLYHGASPPFCTVQYSSGFIGEGQPIVRKIAWNVLRSLLRFRGEYLERSLLPILSPAVLRSAWVELDASVQSSMWEPLLKYLTKFPDAWTIDQARSEPGVQEESDGDSDEDPSDERKNNGAGEGLPVACSEAFQDFLSFLALGCNGSPIQGYPTIVVVLSTIPPSILGRGPDAWMDLLTSFWAALDGKALTSTASERAVASTAFLNALLECLVFLVKRSRAFSFEDTSEDNALMQQEAVKTVVGQQMSRVWEEVANERLKVQSDAASGLLGRAFTSFEKLSDSLFSASWDPIVSSVTAACSPEHCEASPARSKRFVLQLSILDGCWKESRLTQDTTWSRALTMLIFTLTSVFVEQVKDHFENTSKSKTSFNEVLAIQRLAEMLGRFGSAIFDNTELSLRIMALLDQNIVHILQSESSIQLLLAFLWYHKDEDACISLWHNTLHTIASDVTLQEEDTLRLLLSATEAKNIPEYLRARDDEMQQVANKLVEALLESREDRESLRTIVQKMLNKPHLFFSSRTASGLLCRVAAAFSERSKALMHADAPDSLSPLRTPLLLINAVIETRPTHMFSDIWASLPDFFIFGYILPRTELLSSEARALCSLSRQVWSSATSLTGSPHELDAIIGCLRSHLSDMIADVDSRASPEVILQVFAEQNLGASSSVLQDLFPSQHALDAMLQELPSAPLDPALAIVDPLIPPPSMWQGDRCNQIRKYAYDRSGLSKFARIVNGLLLAVTENRLLIRQNIWLLRYFLVLSIAAHEKLTVPSASSAFFSNEVPTETLQDLHSRVMTLSTVIVSNVGNEDWHVNLVQKYLNGSYAKGSSDDQSLSRFLFDVLDSAKRSATLQDARVLHALLQRLLNDATAVDAEEWMILAKRLESQSRTATFAIIRAVNESHLEPPSLHRYRNEVAARALSIGGPKANTDGLAILHSLALMAPDLESDVIFLPQNRAINLMKVFQGWISSDEDISEDVECEMTLVFQHVAPILQDISGSHWDFIFDTVENNLENVSFSDPSSLVSFARTLKLIIIIKDLVATNKSLRAVWSDRQHAILALIRDIVQNTRVDDSAISVPKTICWEMALSVIHDLPSSLLDQESLGKMSHLILDSSPEATKMGYSLLFRAAQKRSEYLVVEAGVSASADTAKYEIPAELLNVVQTALDSDVYASPNMFGYLLGWMLIFDLFGSASLLVKIGYATQLRDLDLVGSSFLPFIFELLEVHGGRARSFVLEPWSVDEYYIQFYDSESRSSPRLLAAHLYYRALLNVPSFISNWWASCRDRQLSTAVASLTMKYYSPVLIAAELRHIRDPVAAAELSGDNWSIKIAAGVGEVGAAYTVDEQVMEIAIRLPPDYPLHGIEVREVQKLGVEENRWRGWLLAVQQIVSSQNGRIVDGLSMFKKNVTHHFENQTECAICYSIISVTELSLPRKRCKTCKNRFHAGCLFKWFNTSHTSSCPLCRSDFI